MFRYSRLLMAALFLTIAGRVCAQSATNLLTNGSMEFWARYGQECLPALLKGGGSYDDARDPLIPVRWNWRMGNGTSLTRSEDRHGGNYALALKGRDEASLTLGSLEVTPGATYAFGVYTKGSGTVTVRVAGQAPEGSQSLAQSSAAATSQWTLVGGTLTVPGHIRVIDLTIDVRKPDLVLDDAHIAAPLDFAYNADDVLSKKAVADADTLLLADFDKDDPAIRMEGRARLVPEGRFGRALRIEKPDTTMIPLKLDQMPPEGTLEFWLSPDELEQLMPRKPGATEPPAYQFLSICNANGNLAQFQADSSCTLRYAWQSADKKGGSIAAANAVSLQRMRKGQWTHVALTWDASALRLYVDGVLYARTTQGPLTLATLPINLTIGSMYGHLCWNGMIDEIRVSKVKRFGPFVPRGAKPKPLPPAQAPAEEKVAAQPAKPAVTAKQLATERATLIGQIAPTQAGAFEDKPNADGDYVYEAVRAKPLVSDAKFEVQTNKLVKGLTTVRVSEGFNRLIGDPVNGGACWKLGAIPTGRYHVGLLYESQQDWPGFTESPQGGKAVSLFLNGRIIQPGSSSDPVQVAPGIWFTEIRALAPETLKPGDEIAVVAGAGRDVNLARLLLHTQAPVIRAGRAPLHYGEDWWNNVDVALRVNALCYFVDSKGQRLPSRDAWWGPEQVTDSPAEFMRGADRKALAYCLLANPLPVPVTVQFECVIKGYYGQVAGRQAQSVTLQPHQRLTQKIPFELTEDDPAYSIKATVKGAGADIMKQLGWPEADTLALFPGYRQSVPWHDPTTSRHAKRITFKQPLKTERCALSLNGIWQRAFFHELVPAQVPPADATWKDTGVPMGQIALAQAPRRQFGAYVRRTFELADDGTPRSYRLVIREGGAEITAYVNGIKVGVLRGSNTPLVADVSTALKPGKNDILLIVRDILAVMDPAYVNPAAPLPSPLYLDAPSSWEVVNRIILGDVGIESSPVIAADDLLITTSFRQKKIAANFAVVNHTTAPVKARVKATVLDARQPVLELGLQEIQLDVNTPVSLKFEAPWADAQLWDPANPYLYVLAVEITDAATDKRLDLSRQRFGFRETWIENADILFNGIRIKPKGVTTPMPYCIDLDYTMGRGSHIPDYMDENGYMASEGISGVCNSGSKHNVDRDVFWETARANVLAAARRAQNHPCIIAWDLSNEWYGFLSYSGADPLLGAKRLRSLTEVLEKQDPNRWTFYNGDEDLGGLHYAFSGHYLSRYRAGYDMDGHSAYAPDVYFFRALDQQFTPGEHVIVSPYRREVIEWGKKLLMNTEHLWKTGSWMPPGPTAFIGEEDVLSPAVDGGSGANAWYLKQSLDGHRDLNCAITAFYGGVCPSRRGWMLQQFIMPEMVHHAYAGATLTRDYSLHSDLYRPAKVALRWQLLGPGGKVITKGKDLRSMRSGDLQRGTLTFTTPKVRQRTTFTLDLRLFSNDRFVYGEQRDIEVWPTTTEAPDAALAATVSVFDPAGTTRKALASQNIVCAVIQDLAAPQPGTKAILIGEDALNETNASQVAKLDKFVEAGGRVIILAQSVTPAGLPVATRLEPKEWASQVFIQATEHPLLRGVSNWDLHFWAPARVTARGAYAKPEGGPATVLANTGSTIGMEWVQLMECYRGKGAYLLCQLPLVAAADQEPMARAFLSKLVGYGASGPPLRAPVKTLTVLAAPGSLVDNRLREVDVALRPMTDAQALLAADVVLIDASHKDAAATAARCKDALSHGTTVVIAGATPADSRWLSDLAGKDVRVTVQPYRMWEGRGYRNGPSPLTAGLTLLDLYWKTYDGSEAASAQAENPQYVIEPLNEYAVAIEGAQELVFPGALLELPVGQGRLVMDQRHWMTPHEQLRKFACRNVSALALGLGVTVAPVIPTRELPAGITYKTIDLGVWANRSMTDKTPDDGKDGWPDQGATCDARGFPTGSQNFQGVPFLIGQGARSVVVLRNPARPGAADFPTEVSIPVNGMVEGFYFVHGSGFTHETGLGVYQIQYADGTTLDVPLTQGVNLWDWSGASQGFAREKGTRSNVAWTGSNDIFPTITIYRMLWVNPKPQVAVKTIRFATTGQSTLMLAGLTAIVAKGQVDTTPQQVAQAQTALQQASKDLDAGKLDAAEVQLNTAVAADPTLTAARQALADLYERKGDEAAAFKAYQEWIAAGASTPLPHNRVGEILEKRKDFKGALEAYTQSLKVEWNQPPIIEAKSRMQKVVLEAK